MDFPFCLQIFGDTLAHMMSYANDGIKQTFLKVTPIGLCIGLLFGCQQQTELNTPLQDNSPVVAEVSGVKFHDSDIDFEILSMPESMQYIMKDTTARARVLDVMIKREAVAQKARAMGLDLDPLIAHRMRQANNTVLIQSVREWQSNDFPKPTPETLEKYYKEHQEDFEIPEQIHARHILVSDKQTAQEVIRMLKSDPDSFSALAAQFSIDDSNKARGGDLNWFSKGSMVGDFEEVAFALSERNRLSKPVKTDFGWHIIEWLGKKERSMPNLEDVKEEIASIIEKDRLDEWIETLMNQADISVYDSKYILQEEE